MNNILKLITTNLISVPISAIVGYLLSGEMLNLYLRLSEGCPIDNFGLPANYKTPLPCTSWYTKNEILIHVALGVVLFLISYLVIRKFLGGIFK